MNILLNMIMFTLCLVLIAIGLTCAIIRRDIKKNVNIIAENQQKLSRQIDRKYNESKESSKWLSSYERGRIDDIILALRTLGNEKLISYTEEINFLLKIRNW